MTDNLPSINAKLLESHTKKQNKYKQFLNDNFGTNTDKTKCKTFPKIIVPLTKDSINVKRKTEPVLNTSNKCKKID